MSQANRRPNPFHVLGLSVRASKEEIVERAEDGIQTAATAQQRELYDWAMRELIGHPHTRLVHELTEVPFTDYRDQRWQAFARTHRRSPANLAGAELGPDDFDLPEAVRRVVHTLLEAEPTGARKALQTPPQTAATGQEEEVEVRDVLFG